jgi:hypothetical protein
MVSVRGDTGLSGADVVFGGDAPGNGTAFMTLGGPTSVATQGYATAPALRTTGSVNLRPLGVDINGQVVEKPGRAIQVDSDPTLAVTPFVVPTDWTVDFNFDSIGNIQASRMVIGSQAHQGAIDVGVDALRRDALPLTLQNQGSGSAGVRLQGNTTAPNDLAVLSAGPITQTGVLRVGSLLLQGTGSNSAVLDNSANDITALTFDQLGSLRLTGTSESGLTLQAGQATGFDAAAGAFTPLDISRNSATNTVLIDTDQLTLGSGISMTGANAQLDLVARTAFSSPGAAQIDTSGGGVWRVWAPTWNTQLGALNGASPTPTLFGCVFGDTSTCSVSQVALPASRSGFFFADQPLLVITPTSVSSPRGRPLPTLPFGVSGLVAGNTAAEALTGALGTPATPDSPLGSYPIQPGSLSSPLGYRLAFSSGTGTSDVTPLLTLTRQVDIPVTPFGGTLAQIMSAVSSDTYGRNLAAPTMCMAPGAARRERSVADGLDLLGLEWGRVRLQPQLSSCVDVASDSSCAGF